VKECTIELQRPTSLSDWRKFDTWTRLWKETYLMTPDEKEYLSIHRPVLMLRAVLDFLQNVPGDSPFRLSNTYECPNKGDADKPEYHAEKNPYHRLYIVTENKNQSEDDLRTDMELIKQFIEGQKWVGSLLSVQPLINDPYIASNTVFDDKYSKSDAVKLIAESRRRKRERQNRDREYQGVYEMRDYSNATGKPKNRRVRNESKKRPSRSSSVSERLSKEHKKFTQKRRVRSSKCKTRSQQIQEICERAGEDEKRAAKSRQEFKDYLDERDERTKKLTKSFSLRYDKALNRRQKGIPDATLEREVRQDLPKVLESIRGMSKDLSQPLQDAIAQIHEWQRNGEFESMPFKQLEPYCESVTSSLSDMSMKSAF